MAPFLLLPHSLLFVPTKTNPTIQCPKSPKHEPFIQTFKPRYALKVSVGGDTSTSTSTTTTNGAPESPKPSRRVHKKETTSSPTSSSSLSTSTAPKKTRRSKKTQVENGAIEAKPEKGTGKTSTSPTKTRRSRKTQVENGSIETKLGKETESHPEVDDEIENYDDGIDFPYPSPPLVCFFGAAQKEFVPQVRVHDSPMHPDIYSEWKWLQWVPPDFARSLGGPSSNVAIAQVRLGGRAAFMGKVGDDEFGKAMVALMNEEKVQTRAVKFDKDAKTARTYMKLKFEDGRMKMEVVKEAAEDSFLASELNLAVLKEARMLHYNAEALTSPSLTSSLYRAIAASKKFGGLLFFDLNLPLILWRSADKTRALIKKAWNEADIIEVSRHEIDFLLDDNYYTRLRNYRHEYYAENFERTRRIHQTYHYTREEIAPLWHDGLKLLLVTDATLRIHYYTPSFDGEVIGAEDVLLAPFTCDRSGSGDALVAAVIRKLLIFPEMYENQDLLERQIRFAIAAGIISQWTIGAVRSFPTESATQNLKEQVYAQIWW